MKKGDKEEKKVLTPTVTITDTVITPIANTTPLKPGECIICKIDDNGNEIADTDITTSNRMWDNYYSKQQNFKLKKK